MEVGCGGYGGLEGIPIHLMISKLIIKIQFPWSAYTILGGGREGKQITDGHQICCEKELKPKRW